MNVYLSNMPNAINMRYLGMHDYTEEVGARSNEPARRRRVSICTFVLQKQVFFFEYRMTRSRPKPPAVDAANLNRRRLLRDADIDIGDVGVCCCCKEGGGDPAPILLENSAFEISVDPSAHFAKS
jgi:hypothetical protein